MMRHRLIYLGTLPLLMASCADETMKIDIPGDDIGQEIRLQAEIEQENISRANDSGFTDGDRIGVFAVTFVENNNPGTLATEGNLANNVSYRLDENNHSWTGDRQLYFPDSSTPVDFYGYYPYDGALDKVDAYPFSVQRNQAAESSDGKLAGYEASDFLWAKSAGVTPSTPIVNLNFRHILAGVQVSLLEGDGFGEGEWAQLEKTVLASNTIRNATINLATGVATPVGDKDGKDITMNPYKNDFRAIVVPQTVAAGTTLLSITVDGESYEFARESAMTYYPSKLHKFTIQVNRSVPGGDYEFTLIDEAITAWESDPLSHNGKVKEYIVVEVPEAGGLEQALKNAGLNPAEIINLKIRGELSQDDFAFMRGKMKYLEALNLKEVIMRHCEIEYERWEDYALPGEACKGMRYLTSVVFPDKLKMIGGSAFLHTNLTGSLDFPEGLEYIGPDAFGNYIDGWSTNLSGTITLPTTLKYIGRSAFHGCNFTGSLILPEGLERIGENAFRDCPNLTGELHLPSSLKELGGSAFENTGFTGHFTIPRHITKIERLLYPKASSFSWPDAPEEIANEAFSGIPIRGDIVIPATVTKIGGTAFAGTEISHIVFPENLEFIEGNVCSWNSFLQDTIVIPPGIETIGERAFAFCGKLDAIILPKKLQRINSEAFMECFSLSYIYCQATVPPEIADNAFNGVEKDNFTVEVPEESVDAYRNAPGWREFKRIASYRNFVARPSKYNVLNNGGSREVILNADAAWEITECPEWCHVDKSSGSMKTVLNITVDRMEHGSPNRSGIISFRLNDSDEHVTHINIGQYDYEYDEDECIRMQQATKGGGVDIFICGDGYDAADISSGLYLRDMQQEIEYFFAVEPYTTYRDYFNVYTSFAMSEDSGVESLNRWRTTKFHTCIGDGSTRLSADWMGALNYCAETAPQISERPDPNVGCILVANTDIYEGVTYVGDSFCAVVTKSTQDYPFDARGLIQHEAGGHGIGWLADEYIYHNAFIQKCKCDCCGHVAELTDRQSWGFGLNLSLDGHYNKVPWRHLIINPAYSDIVDIYEGGFFHSRGVYRSEHNSCMNQNIAYFSTWSRQLIVERIMKLAGENFDLDSFYALDSRATGRDFTSTSRSDAGNAATAAYHGNPPVHIKNYKFGKKGGKR